jgi:ammonium transporter, Amt family
LHGNLGFFGVQALTVLVVGSFSAVGTWGILKAVDRLVGLRVLPEEERMGLDLSQHNERAYS